MSHNIAHNPANVVSNSTNVTTGVVGSGGGGASGGTATKPFDPNEALSASVIEIGH